MTTHAVVTLTITDPDKMAEYRAVAGPALEKYGAKPLQVSPEATWLDGEYDAPDVTVILSFPNRQAALDWRNDPELAAVHGLRNDSGTCRILLL